MTRIIVVNQNVVNQNVVNQKVVNQNVVNQNVVIKNYINLGFQYLRIFILLNYLLHTGHL